MIETQSVAPLSPAEASDASSAERRRLQRFIALRRGAPCFWVLIGAERHALKDISVEGFSIAATTPPAAGEVFDFALQRDGVPDEIVGKAHVVNFIPSSMQAGCRFVALDGDGHARLRDWLVAHVIVNASVRISEKDAAAIVGGPSLI
jgi:hypothetical protein